MQNSTKYILHKPRESLISEGHRMLFLSYLENAERFIINREGNSVVRLNSRQNFDQPRKCLD